MREYAATKTLKTSAWEILKALSNEKEELQRQVERIDGIIKERLYI